MMLDTLGVGLLGTRTDVFNKAMQYSQVVVLKINHFSLNVKVFMLSRCISLLFCSADVCVPGEEQRLGEPTGGAASLLRCLCQRHRGELARKMRRVEEEEKRI